MVGGIAGRQHELLIRKGPLFGLVGARRVGSTDRCAERGVAEAVFVFQLGTEGWVSRCRAWTGDRRGGTGPVVGLDVGYLLAQIRGEGGCERRHGSGGTRKGRLGVRGGF